MLDICVQTDTGRDFVVKVDISHNEIHFLKTKIATEMNCSASQITIFFKGKEQKDSCILTDCGIEGGSMVNAKIGKLLCNNTCIYYIVPLV